MELLYGDCYYDTKYEGKKDWGSELTEILSEFDKNLKVSETNIGHGADFPCFLIEIFRDIDWKSFLTGSGTATASGIFLLGETINKNINAWLDIAKKLKLVIEKLPPSYIDENGAVLLVLSDLAAKNDITNIELSIQIIEGTPIPWGKGRLDKRPDSIYVITVNLKNKAYIIGMTAKRKEIFKHEYGLDWTDFHKF